jgi:hypothetical protein
MTARIGRWLLVASIAVSALALGGIHTEVLAITATLAVAANALLSWRTGPLEARASARVLIAVAIGLTAWTALQTIPLPIGVLHFIAPANADVWARSLRPLHEDGPRFATLSLDPTASRVQCLRGLTYLAVLLAALRVAQRTEGVIFLERVLVVLSSLVGLAAVMHPLLGATKVFGIYEPKEAFAYDPQHLAPLLNLNHLAAFVNIGLLVTFASVVEKRDAVPRPIAAVLVVFLAAITVSTMSRGGTGAMVLGLILVIALSFGRRGSPRKLVGAAVIAIAAVGGLSVLLLAAFDETRDKFIHNNLFKLELTRNALELLSSYGIFGIGRGAFESTFPAIRRGSEYLVYTHPEDIVAQWLTEWGLPIGLIGFAAIGWALRPATPLARSHPPAGAWAAVIAVSLHNLVDYNSETPSVVLMLVLCAAIVTGGRRNAAEDRRPRSSRSDANWNSFGPAAATAVALCLTVPFISGELYNEKRTFRDLGLDPNVSHEQFVAQIRGALLRHPAEPYFPFVGAVRATTMREESVLPWAERALERSPVFGRVHLLLARSFTARSRAQARLEYRLACAQDATTCVGDEALRLVGSFDDAMELVPDGPRGPDALVFLASKLERRLPSSVVRLDAELSTRAPASLDPLIRSSRAEISDLEDDESWCLESDARQQCVDSGLAAAQKVISNAPQQCVGYVLRAELLIASGRSVEGFGGLASELDQISDRGFCGRELVRLAVRTRDSRRVNESIERLLKLGCADASECVENLLYASAVEADSGNSRRALVLLRKAFERAPERDELLTRIAEAAEAQEYHAEALDAYQTLLARHPADPRLAAAVERERAAVARGMAERTR